MTFVTPSHTCRRSVCQVDIGDEKEAGELEVADDRRDPFACAFSKVYYLSEIERSHGERECSVKSTGGAWFREIIAKSLPDHLRRVKNPVSIGHRDLSALVPPVPMQRTGI